ncbi:type VI secretion system baseplate subunit TssG [Ramlibacter sp. XY19]|uniref:type VI secretion system baseplate subunit TssG n=1 Tax=Ramlibacter paludis TaxID=2908000 RepID=UPI0023DB4D42|nr:type VI secretion system baseplate subunit TssG [Ramlibacter paludis]MCG2595106.1 type VI secretion system baseplate subunit TssG [Ramlibacter paludis]
MAITLRPPSDLLSEGVIATDGSTEPAVLDALQAVLAAHAAPVERQADAWSVDAAIQELNSGLRELNLFAALRLLQAAQPERQRLGYSHVAEEDPVRIDQELRLDFAPTEVSQVQASRGVATTHRPTVTQAAVGLLGPNGALPYTWTEYAHELAHSPYRSERDGSFVALVNVVQRRQLAFLYRAWHDSQAIAGLDRPEDGHPVADRLEALAGLALADSGKRDSVAPGFKTAFAAVLSRRVRSPQALAAMLAHYFDAPVRVEEFVARWLDIPTPQRTMLGTQFSTLGVDAVAGARVWDCATCFRIFVGPLDLQRYRSFLPHGEAYAQLADLVALHAGPEFEWELVPVLQTSEVPYSWLGNRGLLLGWSSWLGVRYDSHDAADLNLPMAPNLQPRT